MTCFGLHTLRTMTGVALGAHAMAAGLVLFSAAPADAQRGCASDRPCITQDYQSGRTLVMGWDGQQNWSAYNIRWSRPGRAWPQRELRGGGRGSTNFKNAQRGVTYTFSVQGCDKPLVGRSSCSPWQSTTIKAQ